MNSPLIIAFGSQIKGTATAASDHDFGVFAGYLLSLEERSDIAGSLAQKFSLNEDLIDLVDLSSVSPILKFEVAKHGKLIQGSEFDFIRFKVRAFKEYQDTAKFRRMRERIMLKNHVT